MSNQEKLDAAQRAAEQAATKRVDRAKLKRVCEQHLRELKEKNKCAG